MAVNELLYVSASEVARRIRAGEVTSLAAVEAFIAQIEAVNPALNAVVFKRFDVARAEADAADQRLRDEGADALPPFHGVPCSVKESFALVGMPNSTGLMRRKDLRSTSDAVTVARMRAAGFIPLGVTNTSELCMWMESNNRVYGATSNPYDQTRTVGGSSGGEAAIVCAGGAPIGIGSDVGGSIRMPAFFNGVFGHKSTGGLVPSTGQYPHADEGVARYVVTGPICRHACDLMPFLRIIAGPDGVDPGCLPFELGDPATVSFEGRTLVSIEFNGMERVSDELLAAQRRVVAHFESLGAVVRRPSIKGLKKSFDIWSACLAAGSKTPFGTLMGQGTPIKPLTELAKWTVGRSQHTAMATLLAATESLLDHFPAHRARLLALKDQVRGELLEHMGEGGLLVYPSYPRVAPKHHSPFLRQLTLRFEYAYTALLNVLELPVTQVPLGLNRKGLPLGVQIGATHGQDHISIAAALELERRFGGWVPPSQWL